MKRILAIAALLGFAIVSVSSAKADTDYRCLTLCKNNRGATDYCMSHCSYNLQQHVVVVVPKGDIDKKPVAVNIPGPPTPQNIAASPLDKHKLLETPQPIDNAVLMPERKTLPTDVSAPARDYGCVSECVKHGIQYELCNQSCPLPTAGGPPPNPTPWQSLNGTSSAATK